jgi:hypothetical protein
VAKESVRDGFAAHVPAAFGPRLIFEHDARDSRLLECTHDVVHVHCIAITGIGVGKQGDGAARGDRAARIHVRLQPHQAYVRLAEQRLAQAGAADETGRKSGLFDYSRAVAVEDAGHREYFRRADQITQFCR